MWVQERENLTTKEESQMYYDRKTNRFQIKIRNNVFLLKRGKIEKRDDQYTSLIY